MTGSDAAMASDATTCDAPFASEITALRERIADWISRCDAEIRPELEWQLLAGSKYFRPFTVFACYRAMHDAAIPPVAIESALLIELFHNVSLIIDDIVDKSEHRRNRLTLHSKFGELAAFMTAGYIVADGFRLAAGDPQLSDLFAELLKRLAVAECLQWRLRRTPLGVADWRKIASEDTGSMFEIAACLGDRSQRLRKFGGLLGLLYHGCDDVADVRGASALGGGGADDLRDGILTLPAALAVRNAETARIFANPADNQLPLLAQAFQTKIPEAEAYLDRIAEEARTEARLFAPNPEGLFALIDQTRQLSGR
jgi:geranylgeranyl pyrophosphate synthase